MLEALGKLIGRREPRNGEVPGLSDEMARYVSSSYPHNHSYRIRDGRAVPARQLRERSRAIAALYPEPMTSLLDASCCKGYFVLDAASRPGCSRAMGIDVFAYDVEVCRAVAQATQGPAPRFECLQLHETADRIGEFGGAFQTVLLINCYQYIYFGSDRGAGYLDHDRIFSYLDRISSRCVIFSNRTEVRDCQNAAQVAASGSAAEAYTTERILAAASRKFTVFRVSSLGRYPLWLMVKV